MACIKCGKDAAAGAEFCEECLTDMERHPVKPGTPVILPKRDEQIVRHARKKTVKPEVQIAGLKKNVRGLVLVNAILFLLLAVAVVYILYLRDMIPTSLLG